MAIKAVGGGDPVLLYGRPAYRRPATRLLIANTDVANPLYYGDHPGIDARSSQIPPLGSVGFDGQLDIYASSLTPGLTVLADVVPGGLLWAASPAQIARQLQPAIHAVEAASGGGSVNIFTPAASSRIWGLALDIELSSLSAYTGGIDFVNATINSSGVGVMLPCGSQVSGPSQTMGNATSLAPASPIPIAQGDTVRLVVGTPLANVSVNANATVLYSTP